MRDCGRLAPIDQGPPTAVMPELDVNADRKREHLRPTTRWSKTGAP